MSRNKLKKSNEMREEEVKESWRPFDAKSVVQLASSEG